MNDQKRQTLEAAGYQIGDVGDFLGLSEEERALVELRAAVSAAVRERRTERNLPHSKLAELLKSSQSRVAKIEAGSSDMSLDRGQGNTLPTLLGANPGHDGAFGHRGDERRADLRTRVRQGPKPSLHLLHTAEPAR